MSQDLLKEIEIYREALKNIGAEPNAKKTAQGLFAARECARQALAEGDELRYAAKEPSVCEHSGAVLEDK